MTQPKYFKLEELLTSATARQKSIENLPSWEIVGHLIELAAFLDELRAAWGSGINVGSGFRNNALNQAVGGSATSVHRIGYAADLTPSNGDMKRFKQFVVKWLDKKQFDQCLLERNKKKKSEWVHIGLYNNNHQQRRIIKDMDV